MAQCKLEYELREDHYLPLKPEKHFTIVITTNMVDMLNSRGRDAVAYDPYFARKNARLSDSHAEQDADKE